MNQPWNAPEESAAHRRDDGVSSVGTPPIVISNCAERLGEPDEFHEILLSMCVPDPDLRLQDRGQQVI